MNGMRMGEKGREQNITAFYILGVACVVLFFFLLNCGMSWRFGVSRQTILEARKKSMPF